MTQRSVTHSTFVIERTFKQPPARVFAAFAEPALKKRWFSGPPEWGPDEHELDFRVGGHELSRGGPPGGPVHTMRAYYQDIVPDQRIIYSYDMHIDDARISVSLGTIELRADGKGTRMVLTEQGAYLDGHDYPAQREEGTRALMDQLVASVDG
jgi:uncharacterized protein YndB with AHSA1/START domain